MKHFIFILSLLLGFSTLGQNQPEEDLKVGLVLSGGGAKGLAHIGALKVIEEAGVRIDYIGGTSMGAIIGSLYASGYSAAQLDSIFHETNFNDLIQDDLPREVKSFQEKADAERYAVTLPFENFKLKFPSGLSKGQNLYNLMSRLTSHVSHIEKFKNLPIPFFCMGTNIETGKQVILDNGSLPLAVVASGAIPTLFGPVEIDGQLITDGGVTNNYPIDEVRKKNAEIIIGVDVQDSLVDRQQLGSVFEILTQINNFRTINDMKVKAKKTDLYINPDITGFNVLSFEKGKNIIDAGEAEARNFLEELKQIAAQQKRNSRIEVPRQVDTFSIRQIHIRGNNDYPRNYIKGKLKIVENTTIDFTDINKGINNLSATGNFKKIEYQLNPTENGQYDLVLNIHETKVNTLVRGALHFDELYRSAALINLTQKSLFLTNDILSLDLIAGDNFRYNFRYYIDKGSYWSIGLNSHFNQFEQGVPFSFIDQNFNLGNFNVNQVEVDYRDFTNQFYVETFFIKQFRFGLGLEHKFTQLETETFIEENDEDLKQTILEKSHLLSSYGYLEYDKYDNAYFPSRGAHFSGDFHLYFLESDATYEFSTFSIAKGSLGYAFSPWNNFAIRLQSETGFRIGEPAMNSLDFYLGGYGNDYVNHIEPFLGYDFLGLSGDSYIKGLTEFDFEFLRNNHFIGSYNFANIQNDLYETGNVFSLPTYNGFGLGYGLETFLGPLEVKYTFSPETDESIWFFSLGFWF